jgi:hypothetical protein
MGDVMKRVVLLALALLSTNVTTAMATQVWPVPFVVPEPSYPSILHGDAATAALESEREALLTRLQAASRVPVEIQVDAKTATVLTVDLAYSQKLPGKTTNERASSFLNRTYAWRQKIES